MEIERLRLQYEITKAQLLYEITPAKVNISVKREPLKLTIDNEGFFDSVGIKADTPQAGEQAQKGRAAHDAAGRYAYEKNAALDPNSMNPSELAAAQSAPPRPAPPWEKPKRSWTGGKVTFQAEQDQVSVDWEPQSVNFTYVPYSVEFYIDKW